MAKRESVWIVRWRITQDGDESDGLLGGWFSEYAAQVAALRSINDNWVQGNWDDYPAERVAELRRLIDEEKYGEALKVWEDMPSFYEVEIEEIKAEDGPEILDLEEMGFDDDDEEPDEDEGDD